MPHKDGKSPVQRLKLKLTPALKQLVQSFPSQTYMHWQDLRDHLSDCGAKLTPKDWTDLKPYLNVPLTTDVDAERPRAHTTYVDWQQLLLLLPPSARPHTLHTSNSRMGSRVGSRMGSRGVAGQVGGLDVDPSGVLTEGEHEPGNMADMLSEARAVYEAHLKSMGEDPGYMHPQMSSRVLPLRSPNKWVTRPVSPLDWDARAPPSTRYPRQKPLLPPITGLDRGMYDELMFLLKNMQVGR